MKYSLSKLSMLAVVSSAFVLAGCDQETKTGGDQVATKATEATNIAVETVQEAGQQAVDAVKETTESVVETVNTATENLKKMQRQRLKACLTQPKLPKRKPRQLPRA